MFQTANYDVRAEDLQRAVPGRTIVYCLKTMARRASSACTLQSYQSGTCLVGIVQTANYVVPELEKVSEPGNVVPRNFFWFKCSQKVFKKILRLEENF